MRPDKAIDALDEACAHMQAVTTYGPRTEELIKQRLEFLKHDMSVDRDKPRRESAPRTDEGVRRARANRRRVGGTASSERRRQWRPKAPNPPPSSRTDRSARDDVSLRSRPTSRDILMEEGIVIRGHDVARVVGLMAGTTVEWETRRTQ